MEHKPLINMKLIKDTLNFLVFFCIVADVVRVKSGNDVYMQILDWMSKSDKLWILWYLILYDLTFLL